MEWKIIVILLIWYWIWRRPDNQGSDDHLNWKEDRGHLNWKGIRVLYSQWVPDRFPSERGGVGVFGEGHHLTESLRKGWREVTRQDIMLNVLDMSILDGKGLIRHLLLDLHLMIGFTRWVLNLLSIHCEHRTQTLRLPTVTTGGLRT